MTTPQARRRREITIIVGITMTLLLVLFSSWQNERRDRQERMRNEAAVAAQAARFQKCIANVVHDLTSTLDARSELTEPRAKSVRDLIDDILTANGDKAKGLKAVHKYEATQKRLKEESEKSPIPPFPSGKCAEIPPQPTPTPTGAPS